LCLRFSSATLQVFITPHKKQKLAQKIRMGAVTFVIASFSLISSHYKQKLITVLNKRNNHPKFIFLLALNRESLSLRSSHLTSLNAASKPPSSYKIASPLRVHPVARSSKRKIAALPRPEISLSFSGQDIH
jgi:hypothetical protein